MGIPYVGMGDGAGGRGCMRGVAGKLLKLFNTRQVLKLLY